MPNPAWTTQPLPARSLRRACKNSSMSLSACAFRSASAFSISAGVMPESRCTKSSFGWLAALECTDQVSQREGLSAGRQVANNPS